MSSATWSASWALARLASSCWYLAFAEFNALAVAANRDSFACVAASCCALMADKFWRVRST